jgi:hypothetical protein
MELSYLLHNTYFIYVLKVFINAFLLLTCMKRVSVQQIVTYLSLNIQALLGETRKPSMSAKNPLPGSSQIPRQ